MNPITNKSLFRNPQMLPNVDWHISFFGGHRQTVPAGWILESDRHQAFEIIHIIEGEERIRLEDQLYELHSGDTFLIPPNFSHQVWVEKNETTYFCAHFDISEPTFSLDLIKYNAFYYAQQTEENQILKIYVDKWMELFEAEQDIFQKKLIVQIILSEFLQALYALILNRKSNNYTESTTIKYAKQISEGITNAFNRCCHSEDHYFENSVCAIQVNEIIRRLGISPEYGYEVFKRNFGISPRKFLTTLILEEAQVLLQKPSSSIEEISHILGYSSASHFSRQFKRWTNHSPSFYRKKYMMTDN